jgi:hypothetical protein
MNSPQLTQTILRSEEPRSAREVSSIAAQISSELIPKLSLKLDRVEGKTNSWVYARQIAKLSSELIPKLSSWEHKIQSLQW